MTLFRYWMLWLLLLGTACQHAPPAAASSNDPDLVRLVVVTTTDMHGRLSPQRVNLHDASGGDYSVEIGGVDLLAGYLAAIREVYSGKMVLVDCGDVFQGTMISNEFEGAPMMRAMAKLGYDAAAVGNHEFDFGQVGPISAATADGDPFGALKAMYASSPFPALAANIIQKSTGRPLEWAGFQPYRVIQLGPVRVGLVGVTTPETPRITISDVRKNLEFRPMAETLVEVAKHLLEIEKAEVLLALVHGGGYCESYSDPSDVSSCKPDEELFQLADMLPPNLYSVVMGGHTHRLVAHTKNGTTLLQAGSYLSHIAYAEIVWSKSQRRVVSVTPHLVALCPWQWENGDSCLRPGSGRQVPATFLGRPVSNQNVLAGVLTPAEQELRIRAALPTGSKVAEALERDGNRDSPEGLLVNAILLERHPEARIAILNRSGIRTYLHPGEIQVEDVYQMLPFDNSVATVTLSGTQLLELLRLATSGAHDLPVVRGVKLRVDLSKDPCVAQDRNGDGKREKWERDRLVEATLEDGSAIVADQVYVVVTTSYLSDGGSDFGKVLGGLPKEAVVVEPGFPLLRDVVETWLRQKRLEFGRAGDPWTGSTNGVLVQVFDSGEQTVCPQETGPGR